MRGYWADIRHSARALLRRPGFTLLAVVTLAIGIGSATAIFSFAEAMVLRPLPLPESDRLVRLFSSNPSKGMEQFSVSYPDYVELTGRSGFFDRSSVYMELDQDVSGDGDPERIRSVTVHQEFFETLGSSLTLGRPFDSGDHDPANPTTVVLSETFWTRRFGADSTVIGRTMRLDGVPYTVIGVVAGEQAWPANAAVWRPLQWGGQVPDWAGARSNHTWQVIGRLRPGVAVGDASDRVAEIAQSIYNGEGIDTRDVGIGALVVPLRGSETGGGAGIFFAIIGTAVFMVLLIACMNASGLLLTRAWSRARELSLRSALGAGRSRLVFTLLGESLVLATLGGMLGLWLGVTALKSAILMAPPSIQSMGDVRINGTVAAAALAISLLAALLAGLLPALKATTSSLSEALKEGGQTGHGVSATRMRQGLVIAELAFSMALLVGAGLAVRGLQHQFQSDPGFSAEKLLSFTVRLPANRYGADALVEDFYTSTVERLERHPGILAATSTSRLPLDAGGSSLFRSFIFDSAVEPPEGAEFGALWVEVDPGFFTTLGVEPVVGRDVTREDDGNAPLVAVVNQRLANQMSPGESMLGKQIRSFWDENLPRTVIGVVDDIQFNGVSRVQKSAVVFVPRAQAARLEMAFLVRTAGDPAEMIPVVRQALTEMDPDVALDKLQSLRDAHAADLAGIRFVVSLFASFGVLALVLAVSGVYGLVSYSVSRRTKEIGVRMAMGATAGSVHAAVLRESAQLAAIGLPIGLVLSYGLARALAAGLDGIAIVEPSTFLGVAALLAGAVLAATWVPAMRATRVDPVEALRTE